MENLYLGGIILEDNLKPYGRQLQRLENCVEQFRQIHREIRPQTCLTFLVVGRRTPISILELSQELGVAQSSASRNVQYLLEANLLETWVDQQDRRKRMVKLTPKGEGFAKLLASTIDPPGGAEEPNGNDYQPARSGI